MTTVSLELNEWEQQALNALARRKGVRAEALAHSLVAVALRLGTGTSRRQATPRPAPRQEAIELRLSNLFES